VRYFAKSPKFVGAFLTTRQIVAENLDKNTKLQLVLSDSWLTFR